MITELNTRLFQLVHAGAGSRPIIDGLAVFFAEGGPYLMAGLFALLWFLVDRGKKRHLLGAAEAAGAGLVVNQLIGLFYFHPRPYMLGLCTPLFSHGPETSFPSDHATLLFAAAFYLLLVGQWGTLGGPLLIVAFLTAWGRVYSGIHFPFDMAASLGVALLATAVVRWFAQQLAPFNLGLIRIADSLLKRANHE